MIKLRTLRWEDFSGYPSEHSMMTRAFIRGRLRRSKSVKGDVKERTKVGVMWFEDGERGNELKNVNGL